MQEIKKNNIIIRLVIVISSIFLVVKLYKNEENPYAKYENQDFKFHMISSNLNKEIPVHTLSNDVYITSYFASWCGACKENLEPLEHIRNKTGIRIFGVDMISPRDEENAKLLYKNFFDDILLDLNGNSIKTFAIRAIPVTILVSKSGKILLYHVGNINNRILEEIIHRAENDRKKD